MERQVSHRVVCPTCGAWAQLRVHYYEDRPPAVVMLSCPNQTERWHETPTAAQLVSLIPAP